MMAAVLIVAADATATLDVAGLSVGGSFIRGSPDIMRPKAHGTAMCAVASRLRWGCDRAIADWCCCFNRHLAEPSGYYHGVAFVSDVTSREAPTVFYDSVTSKPLFVAPKGRSLEAFLQESHAHGWPSFRDDEVIWDHVRVLPDGETVSVDGTHLGHNIRAQMRHFKSQCVLLVMCMFHIALTCNDRVTISLFAADEQGSRYCINLVAVAGLPKPRLSEDAMRRALRAL